MARKDGEPEPEKVSERPLTARLFDALFLHKEINAGPFLGRQALFRVVIVLVFDLVLGSASQEPRAR
jgi:hypothetical protein